MCQINSEGKYSQLTFLFFYFFLLSLPEQVKKQETSLNFLFNLSIVSFPIHSLLVDCSLHKQFIE